jgi:hypothetical protein
MPQQPEPVHVEVERDCRNREQRWQLKLRPSAEADDVPPVAWGRNRAFTPRFITVLRLQNEQAGARPRGIAIAVDGRNPHGGSPIRLTLPPKHAVEFARAVLHAAGRQTRDTEA